MEETVELQWVPQGAKEVVEEMVQKPNRKQRRKNRDEEVGTRPQDKLMDALRPPKKEIKKLRDYQEEFLDRLSDAGPGKYLVVTPTGSGKTVMMLSVPYIPLTDKILIITSGTSLVTNPLSYETPERTMGVDMGAGLRGIVDFPDASVIVASVYTIANHLEDYDPSMFKYVMVDEAHHAPAKTYKKVISYFKPDYLIGFTATPNRTDNVPLGEVFSSILFEYSLKKAIRNNYLCDIWMRKVRLDFDLRKVKNGTNGDYSSADLGRAMAHCAPAIAQVYKEYGNGQTLIFVATVKLANEVAKHIGEDAVSLTGATPPVERERQLQRYRDKELRCIVSVGLFVEGIDLPNTESVIMARPTKSAILYTQMVGRGLRLFPGKTHLNLIEIEGIVDKNTSLYTAPKLFGMDPDKLPPAHQHIFTNRPMSEVESDFETLANSLGNIKNLAEVAQNWAASTGYDMGNVNWLAKASGEFECAFSDKRTNTRVRMVIPPADALGYTNIQYEKERFFVRMPMQMALTLASEKLHMEYPQHRKLWDVNEAREWSSGSPSPFQRKKLEREWESVLEICGPETQMGDIDRGFAARIIGQLVEKATPTPPTYPIPDGYVPDVKFAPGKRRDSIVVDYTLPNGLRDDTTVDELSEDVLNWISTMVKESLQKNHGGDIEKLIASINKASRPGLVKRFKKEHSKKYRYLCKIDGQCVPKQDVDLKVSQFMDIFLVKSIAAVMKKPQATTAQIRKTTANVANGPLKGVLLQFPETADAVKEKKVTLAKKKIVVAQEDEEEW